MLAQVLDPWRCQWHPEVWVLVAFLTGAYVYMVRVIGPKAVAPGQPGGDTIQHRLFRRRDGDAVGRRVQEHRERVGSRSGSLPQT